MSTEREIILLPHHTGKNNYTNPFRCPIAMALKDAGYKGVIVSPYYVRYIKFFIFIPYVRKVKLPETINNLAHIWAREKQNHPIKFKMEL